MKTEDIGIWKQYQGDIGVSCSGCVLLNIFRNEWVGILGGRHMENVQTLFCGQILEANSVHLEKKEVLRQANW